MLVCDLFSPQDILVDLKATDKAGVLEELTDALTASYPGLDRAEVLAGVREREVQMSTGIFPAVAIPHTAVQSASKVVCALGISREGIDFESFDKNPAHVFFLVVSGSAGREHQLQVLQKLSFILSDRTFVPRLMEKTTPAAVLDTLRHFENLTAVSM
jgi:mannitol/fructose-specific phosphotransferase system IIA component (Ntr-type)